MCVKVSGSAQENENDNNPIFLNSADTVFQIRTLDSMLIRGGYD